MFIAALFTNAKTWNQPKCPQTDEWIKKLWHIYSVEYYSAIKKNNNNNNKKPGFWQEVNEYGGFTAEWSKPGYEGEALYAPT